MDYTQLPSISFEDLVLGIHREMMFWRLPEDRVAAVLALTHPDGPEKPDTRLRTFFPDHLPQAQEEEMLFQNSAFYPYILQILKNQSFWVEAPVQGDSDESLPEWLSMSASGRYFIFPVPVVATPVIFLVLAPGKSWSGNPEDLCKSVLHMADRLTSLHLASNLLGAFLPATLSSIREERELIDLFAARLAQLLVPARYKSNISGRDEDDPWFHYSTIPQSPETFKVHLRQKVYLLYTLAALKALNSTIEPFSGGTLKINARKEHLRVLMERSYAYIHACWESITKADVQVLQSAQQLTGALSSLQYELTQKTVEVNALIGRLETKLNGIGHSNDYAFYRASYGWMIFFRQQQIMINSAQEDGLTYIHFLLSHPDEQFSIDAMEQVKQQHSRRSTKNKNPRKNGNDPEETATEDIETDEFFAQRGYEFSAGQIWKAENINPYNEAELQEGLSIFERKEGGSFTLETFEDLTPEKKQKLAINRLYTLVAQYFILRRLNHPKETPAVTSKLEAVNKKINALTLYLQEDPEVNPRHDALEFFQDIRVEVHDDQAVTSVSKPKEDWFKTYQNINKAIDRAILSIESAELQKYLRDHIEKGDRCCYRPGPEKINWVTEL